MSQNALSRKVNGNGKVILDTHPESDQHQNWTWSTNLVVIHEPVLEISCGQKQCAHTHRHTPMTTRPCGLRRAGNKSTRRAQTSAKVADPSNSYSWHYYAETVKISLKILVSGSWSEYTTKSNDLLPVKRTYRPSQKYRKNLSTTSC